MDDLERREALADFLTTRRARLSPADVNLPSTSRRRTPGLRREEIAQLANIGTSWYVALEQGRNVHPSEQVLESLAEALQLTFAERRHLFRLAQPLSSTLTNTPPEETVSPSLRQAVQALNPHPAYIIGRRWDLLIWNRAAELVFSFSDIAPPHSRNLIWRTFTSPVLRRHWNWEQLAQSLIAQFRADCARYPGDPWFGELIEDLKQNSEEFSSWWSRHDVKRIPDGLKQMEHEKLGALEFDHVTLEVADGTDQKFILYTCASKTSAKLSPLLER
ncbi:helix-turn-helix transcriptional regulator [Paenibacillus aurantius]|uniref:Helix-turn-helix transcriptional regulator n=1 Tax=Paenibacillus aurantius TaxID=2918900 RepID=A0AA96LDX9_9BACL|nr:helix-turn-helix transcriptional regulator [Paenibacillus aurantius]WNQ10321.1 helix-turn-helix transcriptional regulator [Paenibacillus aurantius]